MWRKPAGSSVVEDDRRLIVRSFAGASSSFEACLTHVGTYPVFSRARTGGFLYHTLTNPTAPTSAAKAKASLGSWAAAMIDDDRRSVVPLAKNRIAEALAECNHRHSLPQSCSTVASPFLAVSLRESRNCSLTLSRFRRAGVATLLWKEPRGGALARVVQRRHSTTAAGASAATAH